MLAESYDDIQLDERDSKDAVDDVASIFYLALPLGGGVRRGNGRYRHRAAGPHTSHELLAHSVPVCPDILAKSSYLALLAFRGDLH
jgi:hypothetical protein